MWGQLLKIITCKEQLLEVISAVEKIKLKEYNRKCGQTGSKKCGDIKEYRETADFLNTKELCKSVIEDIKHFSENNNCDVSVERVLDKLELADINDCIYYDFCMEKSIDFYSFDKDIEKLGVNEFVHIL